METAQILHNFECTEKVTSEVFLKWKNHSVCIAMLRFDPCQYLVINRYDDLCDRFTLNKESKERLDKIKSLERLQSLQRPTNELENVVSKLEDAILTGLASEPRKVDDLVDSWW